MNEDKNLKERLDLVTSSTIYETIHGSRCYNTHTEDSDTDIKGVCLIPNIRYFLGNHTGFEQQDGGWVDQKGVKQDKVIYHLPKFIKMAAENNPNILEILYVDESDIITMTGTGRKLRDNRDIFLSRKARHSFTGYSRSQLHRIKGHKKWLDRPIIKPTHEEFEHERNYISGPLGTELPIGSKILSIRDMTVEDLTSHSETTEFKGWHVIKCKVFDKSGYEAKKKDWENYDTWVRNRNPKRATIEKEHSFDRKHAMHLVRLLRMGYEIITEGKVIVKRPDAGELKSIRNGYMSFEEILKYADDMEEKISKAEASSPLPWGPDLKKIEELQIELITESLRKAGQI